MGGQAADKAEVKVPEDLKRAWDEIRVCATLIRHGQARIVTGTRADGSTYRYIRTKYERKTK